MPSDRIAVYVSTRLKSVLYVDESSFSSCSILRARRPLSPVFEKVRSSTYLLVTRFAAAGRTFRGLGYPATNVALVEAC